MPYADPVVKRSKQAEYRRKNRTLLAVKQSTRYHQGDKVQHAKRGQAWREQHPVQAKAIRFCNAANKRARLWSATPQKLSARELLVQRPLSQGCVYCGGVAETWDHAQPLCLGGPNAISNLNPSCHPCNRAKGRVKFAPVIGAGVSR